MTSGNYRCCYQSFNSFWIQEHLKAAKKYNISFFSWNSLYGALQITSKLQQLKICLFCTTIFWLDKFLLKLVIWVVIGTYVHTWIAQTDLLQRSTYKKNLKVRSLGIIMKKFRVCGGMGNSIILGTYVHTWIVQMDILQHSNYKKNLRVRILGIIMKKFRVWGGMRNYIVGL